MNLPWDPYPVPNYQPIHSYVIKSEYYQTLGKYIDRVIMSFIEKGTYEGEFESFHKIL